MAKKTFTYDGPLSGVTLNIGTQNAPDTVEIQLVPGAPVSLPDDHEYTNTLIALGHLTPVLDNATVPVEAESDSTTASVPAAKARNK